MQSRKGKVERVRMNNNGDVLQLTAMHGRRASVVVPNNPDVINILPMNDVDISVSEDLECGGPGSLARPMNFRRLKSKFQEVPKTNVSFGNIVDAD